MSHPLVSVIIPTYNYAQYIDEAIESIINSDVSDGNDIEVIIVDDGSSDNTKDVVQKYLGSQVNYIYQKNKGKAEATRVAISQSRGKYIFNLDADDWFVTHKIREVVEIFERYNDVVHVSHPANYVDVNKGLQSQEKVPNKFLDTSTPGNEVLLFCYEKNIYFGAGSTFAARGEVLRNIPIPKEVDMYVDEYMLIQTLQHGRSYFLSEPLSFWRIHQQNFSQSRDDIQGKNDRNICSMSAVLAQIKKSQLPNRIKALYELRLNSQRIWCKEQEGQKNLKQVIGLWKFWAMHFSPFFIKSWDFARRYKLLNRSMPLFLISFLRKVGFTEYREG